VKYLFDTDIISALMKGRSTLSLMECLKAASDDSQAISTITVFEIAERTGAPIISAFYDCSKPKSHE
jgi:predicted nucleic acid-binding protein